MSTPNLTATVRPSSDGNYVILSVTSDTLLFMTPAEAATAGRMLAEIGDRIIRKQQEEKERAEQSAVDRPARPGCGDPPHGDAEAGEP
jgi:hypothetical protein